MPSSKRRATLPPGPLSGAEQSLARRRRTHRVRKFDCLAPVQIEVHGDALERRAIDARIGRAHEAVAVCQRRVPDAHDVAQADNQVAGDEFAVVFDRVPYIGPAPACAGSFMQCIAELSDNRPSCWTGESPAIAGRSVWRPMARAVMSETAVSLTDINRICIAGEPRLVGSTGPKAHGRESGQFGH